MTRIDDIDVFLHEEYSVRIPDGRSDVRKRLVQGHPWQAQPDSTHESNI